MTMQKLLGRVLRIVAIGCVLLFSSQSWADSNKDFNTWPEYTGATLSLGCEHVGHFDIWHQYRAA